MLTSNYTLYVYICGVNKICALHHKAWCVDVSNKEKTKRFWLEYHFKPRPCDGDVYGDLLTSVYDSFPI